MKTRRMFVLFLIVLGRVEATCLTRRAFLYGLTSHLNSTMCFESRKEVAWNEYCRNGVVHPCPAVNDASSDFYHEYCPLSYLYLRVSEWPNETFSSAATIRTELTALYADLRSEKCGFKEEDYCKRDEHVCYRGINEQGVCFSVSDVCEKSEYHNLCQTAGQPYQLKKALLELVDAGEDCNQTVDPAGLGVGASVGIVLAIVGAAALVVTLVVVFVVRRKRAKRATSTAVPESNSSSPERKRRGPVVRFSEEENAQSRTATGPRRHGESTKITDRLLNGTVQGVTA